MDVLRGEPRRHPRAADAHERVGVVAGLFAQLAVRGHVGRLARLARAGRDLEQPPAGRVAVLLDEQPSPLVVDDHEGDRAGVSHRRAHRLDAVREADRVVLDVEEAAFVDAFAAEDLGQRVRRHSASAAAAGSAVRPGRSSVIAISLQPGNFGHR